MLKVVCRVYGAAPLALTISIIILAFSGCSNMYEGFKSAGAENCYKMNYPEQQECLREIDISYQTYEKERTPAAKTK